MNERDNETQAPVVKKEVRKVDDATLKKRMDQDKEVRALREEKDRIQQKIEELSRRKEDEEELKEEALQLIQCEDPTKYRKKIIGFSAPFNMTDKDDRIKKDDKAMKYKFKSKEDKEKIKKKVSEIKQQREAQKTTQDKVKEKQYQKHRNLMKNLHHKLLKEKGQAPQDGMPGYQVNSDEHIYDVSNSQPAVKLNHHQSQRSYIQPVQKSATKKQNQFTLESLGQLRYEDLAGNGPDEFNPADVLDEDDTSTEDEVLKRYRQNEHKPIAVNDSIASLPVSLNQNPYKGNQNSKPIPQGQVQEQVVASLKGKHKRGVHNNSIANQDQVIKKSQSKRQVGEVDNSKSKKNLLLNSQEASPGRRNRGITSEDDKVLKKKVKTNRTRDVDLPKSVSKKDKKHYNAYESDGAGKQRYPDQVTRSVKKPSNKAAQSIVVDKSKFLL